MRRTHALTALALGCGLALSACGGDEAPVEREVTPASAQEVRTSPTLSETWPLTGLPVTGSDSSTQDHPVLVLKMDNTYSSSPQVGLGQADLVVEELVEGGMTRLAVFYYSQIPGTVGPVRSMRATDIGIVAPAEAAMVTSGAAPVTIRRINDAGITFFSEGDVGFSRDSSRSAPYNLMADLGDVADGFGDGADRPTDYLSWGEAEDLPKGAPAKRITASFSGGHSTSWTFEGGHYTNQNSYAAPGDEFPADTVLVLRVDVGDAGYLDPAGNPVPETELEGDGAALLFHDGRVVRATWSKESVDAPLSLRSGGRELKVPAGRTWIELVPNAGGGVTFGE